MSILEQINNSLREKQDPVYQKFQCRLMPGVSEEAVIGVRIPELRKLASVYASHPDIHEFLDQLPHRYYDENNLHAFLVEKIRDYEEAVRRVDEFLPYIDNWATCDSMSPKVFKKHTEELISEIRRWMASDRVYTVRFGVHMLMNHYLDDRFSPEYLDWTAALQSDEYYIKMMVAWYFATALAKQYDAAVVYLEEHRLPEWTHKKTIQKACESFRVSEEQKQYLKTLR